MEKMKQCPFCGKEYKDGFFSSEGGYLSFGKQVKGDESFGISCCSDCNSKYESLVEKIGPRFSAKVANLKKLSKKKLSEEDICLMFKHYYEEYFNHESINLNDADTIPMMFGFYTKDGKFFVPEFDTTNTNYSSDKGADLILNKQLGQPKDCGEYLFSKDDVSRIEYKKIYKDKYMGHGIFIYEICFNDPRVMTYKPTLTRCVIVEKGFGLDAKADKAMEELLNGLNAAIGSNLPIKKVSSYS